MKELKSPKTLYVVMTLVGTLLIVPAENWPAIFKPENKPSYGAIQFEEPASNKTHFLVKNTAGSSIVLEPKSSPAVRTRSIESARVAKPQIDSSGRFALPPNTYSIVSANCLDCKDIFFIKGYSAPTSSLAVWTAAEINKSALQIVFITLGVAWLSFLLAEYSKIDPVSPSD